MTDARKPMFDAARAADADNTLDADDVAKINAALTAAGVPESALRPTPPSEAERPVTPVNASDAGIALIHEFEQFRANAYPDPGSKNGKPVTIGWGSTRDAKGRPIAMGATWTRAEADAQFRRDLISTEREVITALGSAIHATSQAQFDALVSFHYNTGSIASATLTRKHKAGDFDEAARQFGLWIYNDGKPLNGLRRRRAAEAKLYRSGT